uniref:Putative rrm motif-containing protein n=1 Tax=Panstrongylus lignarius TaxID=156445 RepID=A0A224XNR2_9HEMI
MDIGLDEIIKMKFKKAGVNRRLRGGLQNGKKTSRLNTVGGGVGAPAGVVDARLKIIEKTRSKLVDARDRLNQRLRQTDARERIMMRSNSAAVGNISVNTRSNLDIIPRRTVPNQQSTLAPPSDSRRGGGGGGGDPLYRTIKNRQPTVSAPPRPTAYMDLDAPENWNNRLANLPRLEIHVPRNIVREREDWLRHGKPNSLYRSKDDIKSRLDSSRQEGYRIVVSNLQPTVTHEDIKELFEDIGTLIGSRVVRPGTAEVVYKNVDDALTAVDTYHNRQLDGQPMKCLLVKPTNSNSRNLSTKGSIVPDLNTVHKALFTK